MPEDRDKTVGELLEEIRELAEQVREKNGYTRTLSVSLLIDSEIRGETFYEVAVKFEHGMRIKGNVYMADSIEKAIENARTTLKGVTPHGTVTDLS